MNFKLLVVNISLFDALPSFFLYRFKLRSLQRGCPAFGQEIKGFFHEEVTFLHIHLAFNKAHAVPGNILALKAGKTFQLRWTRTFLLLLLRGPEGSTNQDYTLCTDFFVNLSVIGESNQVSFTNYIYKTRQVGGCPNVNKCQQGVVMWSEYAMLTRIESE